MTITGSVWGAITEYFRARRWLRLWTIIIVVSLAVLGATGQIHMQGNGYPTIYDISSVLAAVAIWLVAKFCFKTDLLEEYLMGWIFGIQWEFITEPYWTYLPDKFNVLAWKGKDIPLLMLCGWGSIFTVALLFSGWLGRVVFRLSPREMLFDWRILVCDAVSSQLVGSLCEWIFGIVFHCWDYNLGFGIGKSPLGLGWEIHIGYLIIMFWYGTTMRVWKNRLEGQI